MTMQITIHYFAQLKRAAAAGSETVDIPAGSTLAQLVAELTRHHGESFRALVLDGAGQPQRALLYAVGDDQADLDCVLHPDDVVTILAPMAGGSI